MLNAQVADAIRHMLAVRQAAIQQTVPIQCNEKAHPILNKGLNLLIINLFIINN